MVKALQALYFSDYNRMWWQFLKSIDYSDFGNVATASQVMNTISDPNNSPLVLLFKNVTKETQFEDQLSKLAGDVSSKTGGEKATHPVDKEFYYLHNFVFGESSDAALGKMAGCLEQFVYLNGVLESLRGDNEGCKKYAVQVIKQGAGEFPTAMTEIQHALYPSLLSIRKIFEEPVKLAWKAILRDTEEYLNAQWRLRVYDPFKRNLSSFYPFNSSGMDAPLEDFEEFFNPDVGIFWTFFNDELDNFMNRDPWRAKKWEDMGIDISTEMVNTLSKIDDIGNTMFKSGALNLSFEMKPMLPVSQDIGSIKPIVEQVYININGVEEKYYMGSPYWFDVNWPLKQGRAGADLTISLTGVGFAEKKYEGEWGLFRLLDEANIERKSSRLFQLSWNFKKDGRYDVRVSYELRASSTKNPFKQRYLSSIDLPKKID